MNLSVTARPERRGSDERTGRRRLERAAGWLIRPDVASLPETLVRLRERHPHATREELSSQVARRSALLAAVVCGGCGIPGGALSVPAAVLEKITIRRLEISTAALLALLHDPRFFDGAEDPLIPLVRLLGSHPARALARELEALGSRRAARAVLRRILRTRTARSRLVLVSRLGRSLGGRTLRAALPVVSGVVSATLAGIEMHRRAVRVRDVLRSRPDGSQDLPARTAGTRAAALVVAVAAYRARDAIVAAAAMRRTEIAGFFAEARERASARPVTWSRVANSRTQGAAFMTNR